MKKEQILFYNPRIKYYETAMGIFKGYGDTTALNFDVVFLADTLFRTTTIFCFTAGFNRLSGIYYHINLTGQLSA